MDNLSPEDIKLMKEIVYPGIIVDEKEDSGRILFAVYDIADYFKKERYHADKFNKMVMMK